jgi:hypothetical protein
MESLIEQLHDIDGLGSISVWPLAIGYWLLIVLGLAFVVWIYLQMRFNRSWKKDALLKLKQLEKNLSQTTAKQTVISLSEYLRRIALKRYPREECAGLIGEDWIKWLSLKDEKKFNWLEKGEILIKAPYAPETSAFPVDQIKVLIQAAKGWVR